MAIQYKNDSGRLKREHEELKDHNPSLFKLLSDLEEFVTKQFSKDVMITMIYRTQDEQDELYRNDPKYKTKKFKSPHQFWHSLDLRSKSFTGDEVLAIEKFLNDSYNLKNFYRWTAKNHAISGNVDHFHIQFVSK